MEVEHIIMLLFLSMWLPPDIASGEAVLTWANLGTTGMMEREGLDQYWKQGIMIVFYLANVIWGLVVTRAVGDRISNLRDDNRRIKMPDVYWFGRLVSTGGEISAKAHDEKFLRDRVVSMLIGSAVAMALWTYFQSWLPLGYQAMNLLLETMLSPLTHVHWGENPAKDHLMRPWLNTWSSYSENDATFFVRKARRPTSINSVFDGHWIKKLNGKYLANIEDWNLLWYDGYTSKLTQDSPTQISMFFQGENYTAKYVDGTIVWSDGDVWVKDGTLFDGEWWLKEDFQGSARKMAIIHGDRLRWSASNIEMPCSINDRKITVTTQGSLEGDEHDGRLVWANGMCWERARMKTKHSKRPPQQID